MGEFIGLFGHVADVKAVKSLGVCRVVVEVPIEQHKAVTNGFWDADVLITLSNGKQGYGMASAGGAALQSQVEEDYGAYYQALYKLGFFHNPTVWRWAGCDADYQAWVRQQNSCVSGKQDYDAMGKGKCEYAHVRRVSAGAGVGIKPEYMGVPLTHAEHALQHQQGEAELLQQFGLGHGDVMAAREWFDKKAVEYRTNWIKARLYDYFGVSSLRDIEPALFVDWAKEHDLYMALPAVFKEM